MWTFDLVLSLRFYYETLSIKNYQTLSEIKMFILKIL